MTTQPPLELQFHLANGSTDTFVQNDPALAEWVLNQVTRKIFSLPSLLVCSGSHATNYAPSLLEGISLVSDITPSCLLPSDSPQPILQEISEGDFQARTAAIPPDAGEPEAAYLHFVMASGRQVWLEAQIVQPVVGLQARQFINNMFSNPSFVTHRLGGGVNVWNPAQMVSTTFLPAVDAPSGSWPANPVIS